MDADSVSHMMHCQHLITDDDYEAIAAAPNDSKINTVILQYVRAMDVNVFMRFCDVLKNIETQKSIGEYLSTCKYTNCYVCMRISCVYVVYADLATYLVVNPCF